MDEYIPLGKPSYPLTLNLPKAEALLISYCERPELGSLIHRLLTKAEVFLVGGAVRDALLAQESKDIDLAVSISPNEVRTTLEPHGFRVISTGEEHGTLTILADEESIEVTTFRKPSSRYANEFGSSITEDLSGRDFTINAIAYDCRAKSFIDPFQGLSDLASGVCRAVGDPSERFQEDPLRLLRFVRFGSASGRTSDQATEYAARELAHSISGVSVERIQHELVSLLSLPYPGDALKHLYTLGLLSELIPEMLASVGCEQNEFHIHDVFDHTAWVLDRSPSSDIVRLACLLHDIGKPKSLSIGDGGRRHFYNHERIGAEMAAAILDRLKFSKQTNRRVTRLVREHMRPLDCGPAGVRRILRDLEEDFDLWLAVKRSDPPPVMPQEEFETQYNAFLLLVNEELERRKEPAYGRLAINGNDLIMLGVSPGPRLGTILKAIEEIVIEDPSQNEKSNLLSIAKKILEEG
ncbi:MAG: CCA tRNA nucleotidyltransferase [Bdellovibrionales bacterium]|nr:CCA tRNA nucleotidyltransferase [Bdellovibrionales bacterium]